MKITAGHFLLFLIGAVVLACFFGFWVIIGLSILLILTVAAGK